MTAIEWAIVLVPYALMTACVATDALEFFGRPIEMSDEQKPVAWMSPSRELLEFSRADTVYGSHTIPLYTHPVRPLTDDQITLIIGECAARHEHTDHGFARAIEQAHGIGGEK